MADQCGEPLICITLKDFIQLQVPALVMLRMFLDDSLHHTYNYVDQSYTYFCYYVTLGHCHIA